MPNVQVYSFTKINNEIYRPFLPIMVINPVNNISIGPLMALAVTGADDCLFPKFMAGLVGHDLKGPPQFSHQIKELGKLKLTFGNTRSNFNFSTL
jgi:hypothetical protein